MVFVVTGAAGFIGSHICDTLIGAGHKVIAIDSMVNGYAENLEQIINHQNFRFYRADCTDYREINRIFSSTKDIKAVFHQAALGSVQRSFLKPREVFNNNVNGFDHILQACVSHNIKKIVFASSSSVYGKDEANIKIEGKEGLVQSPYAMSKALNEKQAQYFSEIYNIKYYGLRYFNVFGPRQAGNLKYSAVIPKWIHLMKQNIDIEINGSQLTSRDFTYITNVVNANMLCVFGADLFANACYNVGCGQATSLEQLFYDLKLILKSESKIKRNPQRKGDVLNSRASLRKIENLLGYKPLVEYREGLVNLCKSIS